MAALAKTKTSVIVVGALLLAACGELSPAEQARMDALVACSDRASAAFPVLADIPNVAGEKATDEFRTDPMGAFNWTAKVSAKGRPLSDSLTCHGNLNGRTVEFVEFNGVKKQPQPQEVWKF